MPPFRNVRPRDAIAAFERAGGVRRGGKGDHVNIKMPNGQLVTIVNSREPVKVAILVTSIKKAGLTEEQFIRLLKGEQLD
jgi:predicted RNA binding protein YcfA (HicA-like mRNA interferase family)